jgi:hypothetical protein
MSTTRLVAVAAVVAVMAASSTAGATQWYFERHDIPVGETVQVPAHGTLKLYLVLRHPLRKIEMSCAVSGTEAFWNTPTTGMDETRSIAFASCTAPCGEVAVKPALPWRSTLLAPEPFALPDEWNGVRLHFRCGATDYGAFEGTLQPVSGDGDSQRPDEADSFLDFRNNQTLYATNGTGTGLTFAGYYKLGYKVGNKTVDVITGEAK